jgi:hypothetical protein
VVREGDILGDLRDEGMTSDTNDLEHQLRQNLKFKTRARGQDRRGEGSKQRETRRLKAARLGARGCGHTPGNDDLGELRRELKLRREVGTEVAKAKHSSAEQGA